MIKHVGPTNRWDLVSRIDYQRAYLGHHTVVSSHIPKLQRYIACLVVRDPSGGEPVFDSMSEMYWPTAQDIRDAFMDASWKTVRSDQPNLVGGRFMFLAEEHMVLDKLPADYDSRPQEFDAVKYVALIVRKDGMTRDEFRSYWFDKHIPIATKAPGLLRYRACPTTQSFNGDNGLRPDAEPAPWDGMIEMWFENMDSFDRSFRDPYWNEIRLDSYKNLAMTRTTFLVKENLVLDRHLGIDRTNELSEEFAASAKRT
jgi:uncharacterized protein (TIGR02118 family)